jgi:hypothetical protein
MRKHVQWRLINDWIGFSEAAWKIEKRLSVPVGRSEVILRGVCGSGDVRSFRVKYPIDPIDPYDPDSTPPDELTVVRPSEWQTTELDFEDGVVELSEDDLDYWLAQQGAAQSIDLRDPAIERQLALKPRPVWKVIGPAVRANCGKTLKDRGWSDETIRKRGLKLLKRKAGHSG